MSFSEQPQLYKKQEDIYKELMKREEFQKASLNKYGYGSFFPLKDPLRVGDDPEQAQNMKKEGDRVFHKNKRLAYRLWMNALYIYLLEEEKDENLYKDLSEFAKSIISFIPSEEQRIRKTFITIYISLCYQREKLRENKPINFAKIDILIRDAYMNKEPILPPEKIPEYIATRINGIYYN
ncbi:hypothetical protein NEFER03_0322 [Nematocida sp. LUAm3]|nr:hypothetical protein NEFER03_0322 [Nematocida sp. LUAm3]KAI5173774.1 hypothetical protein NEFER02_0290 [Nematocida sp. LUAm2]KAI5176997.1 hypothetical protein NEFER01_0322 [Nematocida sp. LUAm1]